MSSALVLRPGASFDNLTWTAGPYNGTFAFRLIVSFPEAASCDGTYAAHGRTAHLGPTVAFQSWPNVTEDGFPDGPILTRGQRPLGEPHARVHGGGLIDEGVGKDNVWAVARQFAVQGDQGEIVPILFAADVVALGPDGLPSWGDPLPDGSSAMLHMECTNEVRVEEIHVGREVRLFNEATFDETLGAGAHTEGLGTTGIQVGGFVRLDVRGAMGMLAVSTSGDLLLNHVGFGVIEVAYPGGGDRWIDRPTQMLAELALYTVTGEPPYYLFPHVYEAGSGTYSVTATYGSFDVTSELQGVIVGLDHATSLDDLGFGVTLFAPRSTGGSLYIEGPVSPPDGRSVVSGVHGAGDPAASRHLPGLLS